MAVSQSQIVDLLYKQAFGVTKTDTATNKSPSNESIPSPLLIRGDTQWTQSDQIPNIAAAVTDVVQAYTGANAVQCVADNTTVPIGGIYPTWKTNLTYWIPSEFGATYNVQVWIDNSGVANPTSTGTQIFADGSGGTGQYYYNYQSGVLNFIGETIPAALTAGKVLYIVGYRYIGLTGVTHLPSNTYIGNLNFTGTTVSSTNANGNIILTPNGSGIVQVSSALTSNANITATYFIGNGSQLTGVSAGNAATAGTVTDNAQPNITSVGTLISLDITGNLTAGNANLGNLTISNYFSGSGNNLSNIQGSNVTGNVTSAVTANFANYAGNVTVSSQPNITSVGTLTSLSVTGNITGGNISTTGSGGNITGANVVSATTFSGNLQASTSNVSGNTITNNITVNLALSGNTANFTGNIISLNANLGNAVSANFFVGDGGYLTNVAAGNAATAGTVTSNAQPNITSVGTLISLDITGNLTAGNANLGNAVTANYFIGSGNNLSNIQGSNVTGNVTSAVTANFANYAGNVTVSSQPNITSVGTLTSLSVSGNANVGNLGTDGLITATGNVTGGNIVTGGMVAAIGNVTAGNVVVGAGAGGNIIGANLVSANYFTGTLTTNAQPNITSVGTLTSLNVSGTSNLGPVGNVTITGGTDGYYLQTNGSGTLTWAAVPTGTGISNGTSNVNIPTINGNITMSVGGNANIVTVTGTGINVAGTLNATGNANVGNLGTGGLITVTGNITGGNVNTAGQVVASTITSNVATGTAPFTVTSTTQVANLNVATAGTAGTVTTNAQPNITSTGTLTGLTISGNLVANTFQMGYSGYAFYAASVYFATTASIADNQVLWSAPASEISAIDFTIIATDDFDTTRQTCKISAAILGTTVVWNEYGGLYINGGVGSFSVVYNAGTSSIDLVVTPDASNLTEYNIMISKYLV